MTPMSATQDESENRGLIGVFALLLLPAAVWWKAFVAVKLWAWFVVPQFDARPLSVTTAIGLGILIAYWCKPWTRNDENTSWGALAKAISISAFEPAFALLIGYVVHVIQVTP